MGNVCLLSKICCVSRVLLLDYILRILLMKVLFYLFTGAIRSTSILPRASCTPKQQNSRISGSRF
uniref:Uncharacterized protein n=1 Tax=Rhizophora mucronata TaxID=61149 RepID=A0A2P2KM20_RHIMU